MADKLAERVAAHYGPEGLGEKILAVLRESGIGAAAVRPADLAPVDEFHTRAARPRNTSLGRSARM